MANSSCLTPNEIRIYTLLVNGEVVPTNNETYVIVSRLRTKLGPDFIETRIGEGYILGTDQTTFIDPDTFKISRNKEG